jgi:hypothetical protein
VVDAETGLPVARAHVRLLSMGGGSAPAMVTTDEAGSFAFRSLASGSYIVDVDKPSYLHTRYPEPGKTIRTSTRRLTIADGEAAPPIVVPLYRGGVLAGRVVDTNGEPMEYANVQLLALPASGRGRPMQRGGASTNDLGEFRLAHLAAGRYLLLVVPRNSGVPDGPLMVEGAPGSVKAEVVEPQPLPTFFPGVASVDQAQAITIRRGESRVGLEIGIVESVAAWVTGTVVDTSGQPVACCGGIQIRPIVNDLPFFGGSGASIRQDGTFRTRLAPGEYELTATVNARGVNGPPPPNSQRFGRTTISVGADLSDVTLVVGSGARVTGKLVLDGSSALPDVASNPNMTVVSLIGQNDGRQCRAGRLELKPDLTFTIDGVFGTCTPRAAGNVGGWSVKSIQYEGKELLDQPVAFEPGQDLRNVRVVLGDRHTELSVQATDDTGAGTGDFVALAFPTDRAKWTENSSAIRLSLGSTLSFVQTPTRPAFTARAGGATRPKATTITNLPAGEYFVIAIDDVAADGWRDPAVLEKLASAATRVSLADGAPSEITLRRMTLADLVPDR